MKLFRPLALIFAALLLLTETAFAYNLSGFGLPFKENDIYGSSSTINLHRAHFLIASSPITFHINQEPALALSTSIKNDDLSYSEVEKSSDNTVWIWGFALFVLLFVGIIYFAFNLYKKKMKSMQDDESSIYQTLASAHKKTQAQIREEAERAKAVAEAERREELRIRKEQRRLQKELAEKEKAEAEAIRREEQRIVGELKRREKEAIKKAKAEEAAKKKQELRLKKQQERMEKEAAAKAKAEAEAIKQEERRIQKEEEEKAKAEAEAIKQKELQRKKEQELLEKEAAKQAKRKEKEKKKAAQRLKKEQERQAKEALKQAKAEEAARKKQQALAEKEAAAKAQAELEAKRKEEQRLEEERLRQEQVAAAKAQAELEAKRKEEQGLADEKAQQAKEAAELEAKKNSPETKNFENLLRDAIQGNQIIINYQPIVSTQSQEIYGVEAIVCWQHPTLGMVEPAQFMRNVYDNELVTMLNDHVFKATVNQLATWHSKDIKVQLSLNISYHQLQAPHFYQDLTSLIESAKLLPEYLTLNIAEQVIKENKAEQKTLLEKIRQYGLQLSVEHMAGSALNMEAYQQFSLNQLKVDSSNIMGIAMNQALAAKTASLFEQAHKAHFTTITEGVEFEAQKTFILKHGSQYMQGTIYCDPKPAAIIGALLKQRTVKERKVEVQEPKTTEPAITEEDENKVVSINSKKVS